nr:hypothetical protein Hi04_10k_c2089_00009 [uncultured bacterium]
MRSFILLITILFLPITAHCATTPDFNRDVRPILSQNCFKCHGPDADQRKAGLRLDAREGAFAKLATGHHAIVGGQPDQSALVRRIFSVGSDKMPPSYANKILTAEQKQILKRWVQSGATYEPHWAFVAPKQLALPRVKQATWVRNPIDRFILARLEKAGLSPSAETDRRTLIRRVSLDLIGLPPTPAEVDAFVNDRQPGAYERLVDRLLASPHYGERWARRWLDLARYADTNGFEKDRQRSVWPYRDWVINALNADMPFNEFTIEQIAGDMLPNATADQRIATGFHRNTMLNEEGGIDPLEYRYYSMVDRVATTGTTWLGLTLGCCQCHSHKFDPITQREYYRVMACMDNAEEITIDVTKPDIADKRKALEKQIAEREAHLADRFPVDRKFEWKQAKIAAVQTKSGAKAAIQADGSALISGVNPETDSYTITLSDDVAVDAIRLEALPDPSLGGLGPGRTPHGNFVLTRVSPIGGPVYNPISQQLPKFVTAEADFSQNGFPASAALDNAGGRGWAVDGPGQLGKAHTATFTLDRPIRFSGGSQWQLHLEQNYGDHHTIGRFRIWIGTAQTVLDGKPIEVRRKELMDSKFADWLKLEEAQAVAWTVVRPTRAAGGLSKLNLQPDGSLYVNGDTTKKDLYDLDLPTGDLTVTAIRLEALPDDRLPRHGPGRTYYEGGFGDFYLSELTLFANGKQIKIASATQNGGSNASDCIDGDPQSGWSINGRQGETTIAVFRLAQPIKATTLNVKMLFDRYFASSLGRFRLSVTTDPRKVEAGLDAEVDAALTTPVSTRTSSQKELLFQQFLHSCSDLKPERDAIAALRSQLPDYPTAFVFRERPEDNPRVTQIHHRGEFLQTEAQVFPGTPAILPGLSNNDKMNRLGFAQWLVSPTNPLTARVAVNRQWAAFFGKGIVKTLEDFGYQGTPPTHPELLDWLAVEFQRKGWSLKQLHKLIVMSATYRQSSRVTPIMLAKDPENRLLARAPRIRLDAEELRDSALTACGLLSPKIGGPSVFPPQPPSVSSEGAYGALNWTVSPGEDKYRRGLYTFSKRTAPYAMFTTFDAPTGEVCVARREVTDTPTQALTLLNDQVFVEAAQALGKLLTQQTGSDADRVTMLFTRCLSRPPSSSELSMLLRFTEEQKQRFDRKELDAMKVAGPGEGDLNTWAVWTTVARTVLNLDEAVTKQ